MTTRERAHAALVAARARIELPARWTQGTSARAADGEPVEPDGDRAQRWCPVGAVMAEAWALTLCDRVAVYNEAATFLVQATKALYPRRASPAAANDVEGHDAALAILAEAARLAARRPA